MCTLLAWRRFDGAKGLILLGSSSPSIYPRWKISVRTTFGEVVSDSAMKPLSKRLPSMFRVPGEVAGSVAATRLTEVMKFSDRSIVSVRVCRDTY